MKRWMLTLALTLGLCLTAGAAAEERVRLTVGIAEMPEVIDFETNRMTRMLEEEAGVELDFVTYVGSDMLETLNVEILAGGDSLPDILMFGSGHWPTNTAVYNWALNDAIIPLTRFVNDPVASANLNASIENADLSVDLLKMITMPDGESTTCPAITPPSRTNTAPRTGSTSPGSTPSVWMRPPTRRACMPCSRRSRSRTPTATAGRTRSR